MANNVDQLTTFLHQRFEPILLKNSTYTSDGPPHPKIKSEASVLVLLDRRGKT